MSPLEILFKQDGRESSIIHYHEKRYPPRIQRSCISRLISRLQVFNPFMCCYYGDNRIRRSYLPSIQTRGFISISPILYRQERIVRYNRTCGQIQQALREVIFLPPIRKAFFHLLGEGFFYPRFVLCSSLYIYSRNRLFKPL